MTLTLTLPERLEKQLTKEAAQKGYSATAYAQHVLEEHLQQRINRMEAVAILQSWIDDGDEQEQKETGAYLIQALDADRLSSRPLFPLDATGRSILGASSPAR